MKILILGNSCVGLYKFRKELLQRLVKDHEVFISVPDGQFINQLKQIGCQYIETPIERRGTNPFKDLGLYRQYEKMLDNVRPDIVLTYTIKPNVYGGLACQRKKIPYVANITGLGSAVENGGLIQKISLFLYRIGLRKAQMVFLQNEDNLDFMLKHKVISGEYDLLPGSGVNLDQYKYMEYPKDDTVDFVYIGRMMSEKGFGLYIDAAQVIKKNYPQSRFHICGAYEDDYKQTVEKLIDEDVVIFHGLIDDMVEIYRDMDCTVHPTYYPEGMSNVLLESLACGRPIITTDRPGCKEIVDDGVNGFVVKQRSLDSLIEKIEKFLSLSNKERKQLGQNGRKKVEQYFDRNIVVDRYLKEIDKVNKNG